MKTDDIINNLLGGGFADNGWAGLQGLPNKQGTYEQELENYEKAKSLSDAFIDKPEALAHLRSITIEAASFPVEELGLVNAVGYGIFREGQNSIYKYILGCIDIAKKGPPTPPKQESTENAE